MKPKHTEYFWMADGTLSTDHSKALKCLHKKTWNVLYRAYCHGSEEVALPDWTYCDCRTHVDEHDGNPCERPYSPLDLEAAIVLARLQGIL